MSQRNYNNCYLRKSQDYILKYKGNIKENYRIQTIDVMSSRKEVNRPDIVICNNCGFAWSYYNYNEKELKNIYEKLIIDEKIILQIEKEKYKSIKRLYNDVINKLFDSKFKGKVFDIGANTGTFLYYMKELNWSIFGLEPSSQAVNFAKNNYNISLINEELERFDFNNKNIQFDLITAYDVIEHLIYPDFIFKVANQLLKPDGYLILSMPNYNSIQRKVFGKNYNLFLIEHINYFNPETIKTFASKYNFNLLKIQDFQSFHSIKTIISRLSQHFHIDIINKLPVKYLENIYLKIKRGDMITVFKKSC